MIVNGVSIINPMTGQVYLDKAGQPLNAKSQILLPLGRVSYPHLITRQQPRADKNGVVQGEAKFKTVLAFPDSQPVPFGNQGQTVPLDLHQLFTLLQICKNAKWPHGIPQPIMNFKEAGYRGDPGRYDFTKNPTWQGMWVFNASNKNPVSCAGPDGKNMDDIGKTTIYSGCWVRAYVNAYAYDTGSNGISLGLCSLRKELDDEPLVQSNNAENDFSEIPISPAALAQQQQSQQFAQQGQVPGVNPFTIPGPPQPQYGAPMQSPTGMPIQVTYPQAPAPQQWQPPAAQPGYPPQQPAPQPNPYAHLVPPQAPLADLFRQQQAPPMTPEQQAPPMTPEQQAAAYAEWQRKQAAQGF